MVNENGIIVKKTNFQSINFVKIITPEGKIDAVIYGKKQISLLYIFNFELVEPNKKNLYIVRKFNLVEKFEQLNTKEKLVGAFFVIDVASQIDIDYNFIVKTVKSLEKDDVKVCIKNFVEKILVDNGVYRNHIDDINNLVLELEKYLGKKLKVGLNEVFTTAR
ncbi:hypothetical protein DESAMIL20_1518 [Desulfurella amilsii]|uniref:DNA repair protein RecO n=1 Tax=Desulfurella amilsii TaxID=1562698 RepID=A0A1X4XWR0_9BACT|nr:hypothetical protein [Desulfurella amilsii]OSS41965.1 hypothetical protein DESAMIL20_1518 [Desulfurella amilsii]